MRLTVLTAIALFALLIPVYAQAPEPAAGVNMTGLFRVYVLDRSGEETAGRLVSLTSSAVVLQVDGATRTFNLTDVTRIYRRGDSLKNGAIIGAIFGGATGLLTGGFADCPDAAHSCPGTRVALGIVSTGIWAAIGAGIDALIPGRTLLWKASSIQSGGSGITLALSLQRRSVTIGWNMSPPRAQRGRDNRRITGSRADSRDASR